MSKSGVFATSARCAGSFRAIVLLAVVAGCGGQIGTAQAAAKISVLGNDSCAIATDGRVQCWGDNAAYDGAGAGRAMDVLGFPADVTGLAGSLPELCALTATGALWCQGNRPGNGTAHAALPVIPTGMDSGVVDVARNYQQVCVVKDDGSVWCWGYNYYGLGDGSTINSNVPVQILPAAFGAAGVAVGNYHGCAWNQTGEGRCWGDNYYGQLGDGGGNHSEASPVTVAGLGGIQAMSVSIYHTCALIAGGSVYCWGSNHQGQLGSDTLDDAATPVLATRFGPGGNQGVFTGGHVSCAQPVDGDLICQGRDEYRQLAASGALSPDPGQVALGVGFGCAMVAGRAHCWGRNDVGSAGNGRFGNEYLPVKLLNGDFSAAPSVALERGCGVRSNGEVRCWGGTFALPPYAHEAIAGIGGLALTVHNGGSHQCVLRDDAKVLCWGANDYGSLGDGTTQSHQSPAPLAGMTQVVTQLSVGVNHGCALLADASVACWGWNFAGQAGGEDLQDRLTPGPVTGLADAAYISAGFWSSCAVTASGAVWCWGSNAHGVLGEDIVGTSAVPVQIEGLPAAALTVSVGNRHACALLVDGHIACWGSGSSGQLGQGQTESSSTPVLVASAESFVQVVAGYNFSCARSSANEVFCWGSPGSGALGLGPDNRNQLVSVPQALGRTAMHLAATPNLPAACALDAQGDAWCWGNNDNAQLGIGRRGVREAPGPVMGMGEDVFFDGFEP